MKRVKDGSRTQKRMGHHQGRKNDCTGTTITRQPL